MEKFKTFICIDDTDELGYEKSTGSLSVEIMEKLKADFNTKCSPITRHQLFLDERIPYTSHNSSMCFICDLSIDEKNKIKKFIITHLKTYSAPTSQPGICIGFEKDITNKKSLIEYGLRAKKEVLTKEEAYELAKIQNFDLIELKNDGNGVIGALAGVALRFYGNDGKLRGGNKKLLFKGPLSVDELLKINYVDEVRDLEKNLLDKQILVNTNNGLKIVMLNHKKVLLIKKNTNNTYEIPSKEEVLNY